jgi:hypothetical protein
MVFAECWKLNVVMASIAELEVSMRARVNRTFRTKWTYLNPLPYTKHADLKSLYSPGGPLTGTGTCSLWELTAQPRNQAYRVLMANGIEIAGRQSQLL